MLARSGCVTDAARVAGVSTTSVARSRRLFPLFDRACVEALAKALRGLEAVTYQRAVEGRETIIYRNGKEYERRVEPSDSLLRLLIQRGDLTWGAGACADAGGRRGVRAAGDGAAPLYRPRRIRKRDRVRGGGGEQQRHIATQEETDAVLIRRIDMVLRARRKRAPGRSRCAACGQACR